MLTKEQFLSAMTFFDSYDNFQKSFTDALSPFFDGNGFMFIGCSDLYIKYLKLLQLAMNIDPDEEYDPISYWLYEANNCVYDEPDKDGFCKIKEIKKYKLWDVTIDGKPFRIKNNTDLYKYIKWCYGN